MSAGRLLEEFKMCGLIGDVALMAACWIVLTIPSAALSMLEWVLSATFRLIIWSKLNLNLSQSIGPLVKEGLEFNSTSPVIDKSMGEWSLDRSQMFSMKEFM